MKVLEFEGLINMPVTKCGLVQFIQTCGLLNDHSINYRTRRDVIEENVVTKMYIIFDNDEDYSAYQLIK